MAKTIFAKDPHLLNIALAAEVKKIPQFVKPEWMTYVKTGVSKQRVPESEDFWFIRAASILRQLYLEGVVGVERLRTRYGGRKNRGVRPARFKKSSGKIIRVILQQAEKAGLVETVKDKQFGRRLTLKGRQFLDEIIVPEKPTVALSEYIGKEKVLQEELNTEIDESYGSQTQSEE